MNRNLKFVVKFCSIFLGILGSFWIILEPFNLHEHVFPRIGLWRYIIVFLLSICFSLILLIFDLKKYSSIRLYQNKLEVNNQLKKICNCAKKRIWIFAISNRSFVRIDEITNLIGKLVSREVEIRWINLNENSIHMRQKEIDEDKENSGRIMGLSRQAINIVRRIKQDIPTIGLGSFSCRSVDVTPTVSILIVDDKLWFSPYLYKIGGNHCPVFELHNNILNNQVFRKFEQCFTDIWDIGNEID